MEAGEEEKGGAAAEPSQQQGAQAQSAAKRVRPACL
jgi:hypothetical protein